MSDSASNAKPKLMAVAGRADKRTKFVEIAERRTKAAIVQIRRLGNLANRNAYEFTDADVKKITNALSDEIDNIKTKFAARGGKQDVSFNL